MTRQRHRNAARDPSPAFVPRARPVGTVERVERTSNNRLLGQSCVEPVLTKSEDGEAVAKELGAEQE